MTRSFDLNLLPVQRFSLVISDRWLRDVVSSLFSDESDEWQG
ncbi:MAG TPA: hypothetical protein VN676_04590 [Steroidobacteraceae bacterium]|jgi:hypothetical protein|nr:hypothetical protein [Steroidobacteraceae bacterium]